ncbi:MAG: DNA primase [Gammaproteobacteria bacterium]|nr:MAG: DNA primase [Gammaproteobacteria bacterium]TLY85176.1 MAG: DNA primase [Gammaproteobacteria bacterium]
MGRIPQNFIDELIARADIVEVIGARVQLKKAGREYKACCPFHNEKTPSFSVSPDKQFYHCFGCGKHGTVLGFLMEHDHMAFPEAVEELATRFGLQVPHEGGVDPSARRADEPLFELMERVARFYAERLAGEARARDYLAQRGLAPETIARFGLGYAPNSWNEVLRRFGAAEPDRQRLADAGLIVEREGGQMRDGERHYDRFRDRIMFPIRDARGRVIAFGGRVIDAGEPKYLNSPETVLFHKGRELYGIYETRRARANLTRVVVVEGYMDVVRLHQSGLDYALATLGTATTPEHLRRIFRLVPAVVFAFDGDRAGRAAAWRALQQALPEAREGREMRFLFLPEGQDPDTLVGAEGRAAFEQRLQGAVPLSEYLVRELSEQSELAHADGRARFAESARPLFARVPEGVYRELLLERLAAVVGLPPQRLEELWTSARKPPAAAATPPPPGRRASARRATGAGRGSLVRQAIVRLLHYPAIAGEVSLAERAGLDASEEPGIGLLRDLLDNLRAQPAQISAQVIQRWSGREGGEALQKLLEREEVITDAAAAAGELRGALVRLADLAAGRRLEALEAKSRTGSLAQHELEELQRLIKEMGHRDVRGG